ncbi:MAG: hypothetical protein ACKO37_08350 [Vampirovibrionales bacterium]
MLNTPEAFQKTPPPMLGHKTLTQEHTSFASSYHYAQSNPKVYQELGSLYANYFTHLTPVKYQPNSQTFFTHTAPNQKTFDAFKTWISKATQHPWGLSSPKTFEASTQAIQRWFQSECVTPGVKVLSHTSPIDTPAIARAVKLVNDKTWDSFLNAKDHPFAATQQLPLPSSLVTHWVHGHITSALHANGETLHLPPIETHGSHEARQYRLDLNSKVRHGLKWTPDSKLPSIEHTLWLEG